MSICSRRRDKILFIRFKLAFLDSLSRLEEDPANFIYHFIVNCFHCIDVTSLQQLLTNGENSSREFVDPPGEFELNQLGQQTLKPHSD